MGTKANGCHMANGHFGQMSSWENGHGKNGFSNYGIAGDSTILNKCVGVVKGRGVGESMGAWGEMWIRVWESALECGGGEGRAETSTPRIPQSGGPRT